ncbi:hypothetical protein M0Q97_02985 [Candidatus Dojkabacteria bacterium]|jgi:hypothetical protein|nr:hypothetical protein [Candidatus Dojkabacteria bacterium]
MTNNELYKLYALYYRIILTKKDILDKEDFIQKVNDYYAYIKYVKGIIEIDNIRYPIFIELLKDLDKIPDKIDTLQNKITSIEKIAMKSNYYYDNKEKIMREIKLKRILE